MLNVSQWSSSCQTMVTDSVSQLLAYRRKRIHSLARLKGTEQNYPAN